MTDKLYNGFREGRAPGDHKPNNQVRGMTQETMTKEQILEKQKPNIEYPIYYHKSNVLDAMEEYAQQQLSAERERAGKLVDSLQKLAWHLDTLKAYHLVESIKQTLNEYDTATKEPGTH